MAVANDSKEPATSVIYILKQADLLFGGNPNLFSAILILGWFARPTESRLLLVLVAPRSKSKPWQACLLVKSCFSSSSASGERGTTRAPEVGASSLETL